MMARWAGDLQPALQGSAHASSAGWRPRPANPSPSLQAREGPGSVAWNGRWHPGTPAIAFVMNAAPGGCTANAGTLPLSRRPAVSPSRSGSSLQFAYRHTGCKLRPLLCFSVCFRLSAATIQPISAAAPPQLQNRTAVTLSPTQRRQCCSANPETAQQAPDRGSRLKACCRRAMFRRACQLHRHTRRGQSWAYRPGVQQVQRRCAAHHLDRLCNPEIAALSLPPSAGDELKPRP